MKKTIAILLALLFLLQAAFVSAWAEGEIGADVPLLESADAVAAYIREEMAARKSAIRFKSDAASAAGATLARVCAHTGNGTEGDYLRLALNYVMPQSEQGADDVYTLHPVYYTTAEQEAAVDAYVETVVAGCTAQDATEKARYLYDYLCENVAFDLENLYNDEDVLKYTAYGAVVNGRAVCQGFATLYYKLALAAGLNCRIVTGTKGNVAHAWNIIEIGEQWYHVDASSGAQLLNNTAYFMKPLFDGYTIRYGAKTASEIQNYAFFISDIINGSINEDVSFQMNTITGEFVLSVNSEVWSSGYDCGRPQFVFHKKLIKSVIITEGTKVIPEGFFRDCTNLEEIRLPSSLSWFDAEDFCNCPKIQRIRVSGSEIFSTNFSGSCLYSTYTDEHDNKIKCLALGTNNCTVIPSDVKKIDPYAFEKKYDLKSITLPNKLDSIGFGAFEYCDGLTEVVIPTITDIGAYAFRDCKGLQEVSFKTAFSFPVRHPEIKACAFSGCEALKRIDIPKNVNSIADDAFQGCSNLESITVDPENTSYHSENNCLIQTEEKKLIAACKDSVIPADGSVTCLMLNSLNKCSELTRIDFPDCITEIHGPNDVGLTSVAFPNGVTNITGFKYCTSLTDISIPNSVKNIDAFNGCTGLKEVVFPNGITNITGFDNCDGLTSVTIPKSTVQLGYSKITETSATYFSAFLFCDNLKTITILSKDVTILNSSFYNDPSLTTVYGFKDSTAEAFAQKRNLSFVSLCPLTNEPHITQPVDVTEPDCLNPGYTAGTVCVDCGEWVSGHEQTAEPLGHNPGEPVPENVVAATCTAEGSYDNVTYCTRCGVVLSSTAEKIAMTPHTDNDHNGYCDDCEAYICAHPETALQNAVAAACTETGYSGDTVCTWCGVTLEYGVTLAATGHSPAISKPAKDATCLDEGTTAEIVCSVCNDVLTPAQPTPIGSHADSDGDGLCDVCLAPTDCTQYGRCGGLFWYADNGSLVISGAGASGDLGTVPWESCADAIDCVYLRGSVTAMDGAAFAACPKLAWVFAPAGATVSRCGAPVLCYADENGAVTVSGRDGAPAMDLPALLNAADVLCTDRVLVSLCFERLSLCAADGGDKVVYDILKNGKLIDEHHFRLPSGTELTAFSVKPLGYPSYNAAFAAMQSNPDRNLILSLSCTDLLPENLKSDSASYTEQFVLHFVDEPETPETPEPPAPEKPSQPSFFERFTATLAAILSVFKSIFRIFRKK